MRAVKGVLQYLLQGEVDYIFGIPAGSVNAFFDELYDTREITPIIAKHEGAAAYMAAAYAKYSDKLAVCIGCSGPGSTNLLTGAAHAMREHLPVLFLTGSVPRRTVGLNASQEFHAAPLFEPVTKYSVYVERPEDLLPEVARAVEAALSGVPGPVHVAMPIDVQMGEVELRPIPPFPARQRMIPDAGRVERVAAELAQRGNGFIFLGQGAGKAAEEAIRVAELLNWPIVTTPQAKGIIPDTHPLFHGVFGFAGHTAASHLIEDESRRAVLIVGSSLGETATSNWNDKLTRGRFTVQIDIDETVFNRVYPIDVAIVGDANLSLQFLIHELEQLGLQRRDYPKLTKETWPDAETFSTQHVLRRLQRSVPASTRFTIDIGEFMSYVIHYMDAPDAGAFDINVHFGAMGTAIGAAIGSQLADPERPTVCITGDGCFFMHGMEVLTAKEYGLPILFVVMNNARLGMVYHGHELQYKRSHPRFGQEAVSIAAMAAAFGLPTLRIERLEDLQPERMEALTKGLQGPAVLEVALVDNSVPPMGDRVKFLSSFQK